MHLVKVVHKSLVISVPKISDVISFFNPEIREENESSSDEEENVIFKKDNIPQIRLEEERIYKIENELADSSRLPENADQFDRLMLGNPNSSELWTKYMSFHLAVSISICNFL